MVFNSHRMKAKTSKLIRGSSGLPILLGLWLGLSLLSHLDRSLAGRHAHRACRHGCQVQTFLLSMLTSFSAASLSATSLGSRRNASPAWSPSSSSSRRCRAPSRLATTSPSTRVPASAFLATTRTTCKEISTSWFHFSSAATGQVHHWTGVTPRWWQWGRRTSRLMPSSSLALKIPMAANLGPQPMACMISLSSCSKIQTDQLFLFHTKGCLQVIWRIAATPHFSF